MALRRELLPILLAAAFLLIGPGQALATPTWLDAETADDSFVSFSDPAVATDADGNSVAVWNSSNADDEVRAIFRPRGGPWDTTIVDIEPDDQINDLVSPRAVALPDGSFAAVWVGDRNGDGDTVLRSATRSPSGEWAAQDVSDLNGSGFDINGLGVSADGSVTVVVEVDGVSFSSTRPAADEPWGALENLGIGAADAFAAAPDGSAIALNVGPCTPSVCIRATHRRPSGGWGAQETVWFIEDTVSGFAVTAGPDSSYTAVWGVVGGEISSADRPAGAGQAWSADETVADVAPAAPAQVDVATGASGRQVAAWQQQISENNDLIGGAVRSAGGDWVGPELVSGGSTNNGLPHAAITTTDVPVVAWSSNANNSADANGSYRDAAGGWNPKLLGSSQDDSVSLGEIDADGDGNALTAFRDRQGVFTAGFDAGGPRFGTVSIPAGGSIGQALPFSATAGDDNWSSVKGISWLFGDGTGAAGGTVTHAYGAAGAYAASAIVTDTVDNATTRSGTVAIPPAPTPGPVVTDPCSAIGPDADDDGIKDCVDPNNGAERPQPFKTVNATVVSGEVFVKLPPGSNASAAQAKPPKGFVRLTGAETIPVGATLDTKRGRVKIRSAATTGRKLQTGQFFLGRFTIRQARIKKRSKKLITDMRLNGSSFKKACSARASISAKRKRSKKRVRRLFGDAKGSFRTSGRNAAATVRGTRWGVQDRCDGTLVTVQRGRVAVRDKVKRRTVVVRRGHRYLARAR